jgi:hypothetical protein
MNYEAHQRENGQLDIMNNLTSREICLKGILILLDVTEVKFAGKIPFSERDILPTL